MGKEDDATGAEIVGISPPTLLPERFEDFEGFRETTLSMFTDPEDNAVLRGFSELLCFLASNYPGPHEPDGRFFHKVRAVMADLRHLEGWLGRLDRMREEDLLEGAEVPLSVLCGALVPSLKAIADALEAEMRKLLGAPEVAG